MVASRQRRGAETFASDLVRALNEHEIEQHVAVLHSGNDGVWFDAPVTELKGGIPLPGVRMQWRTLAHLRSLATTLRPDAVQAHGGEALKYAAGLRARVVYRKIGLVPEWRVYSPRRAFYGALARRATAIVPVAEALRRQVTEMLAVPPDRVVMIPNGVDRRRLQPRRERAETRAELGVEERNPLFVAMCALAAEKDPLAHIAVADAVSQRLPEARFVIAGDGPLRPLVERAIRERGLMHRVRLVGNRSDVGDLLAAADVAFLASRGEGMPAVVIEAGLLGVPVAAYATGGIPEVIVDGSTGRLAPQGDVELLSDCLLELAGDPVRRRAVGRAAFEHCIDRFDIKPVAERYADLYRVVAQAQPVS